LGEFILKFDMITPLVHIRKETYIFYERGGALAEEVNVAVY